LTNSQRRSRFDIAISWEIDAIELFLKEAPAFFERRVEEAGGREQQWMTVDGRLTLPWLFDQAKSLSLEGVIYQLNNLVVATLLALCNRLEERSPEELLSLRSRSRAALVETLEKSYRVRLRFLPGWIAVEKTREDANSLKHRGGMTIIPHNELGAEIKSERPSLEEIRERVAGIREWLFALWQATEGRR
jgi:hypothetical protein